LNWEVTIAYLTWWHVPEVMGLFAYAFVSNVAMAVVPHEPVVIWYGARWGIWLTAVVATAGTVAASWVDHRLFASLVARAASLPGRAGEVVGTVRRLFARAPFAVIVVSGVTPLPFFPFKAVAFLARYPIGRYLAAVAAGRFPRYVILAWLGIVFEIPAWLLLTLFVLMLAPSMRILLWKRQNAK
jgi:membrane protein YqaA with SNARE-associated domain